MKVLWQEALRTDNFQQLNQFWLISHCASGLVSVCVAYNWCPTSCKKSISDIIIIIIIIIPKNYYNHLQKPPNSRFHIHSFLPQKKHISFFLFYFFQAVSILSSKSGFLSFLVCIIPHAKSETNKCLWASVTDTLFIFSHIILNYNFVNFSTVHLLCDKTIQNLSTLNNNTIIISQSLY